VRFHSLYEGESMSVKNDRSKGEAEIRDLIESWSRAVRTEDVDGVLANHSSEILMFDLPGPVQLKGIKAYEKSWPPLFAWIRGSGAFDLSEINVTAGDDVAFATALIHCHGTQAHGKQVQIEGRLTIGLRKINSQWTVMHEHHSEPSPSP
jgi:uncharacterized protein (TIGR02246 family)